MALWLLVLLILTSYGESFECPDPCRCFPNFDAALTITVDCRGQDLFEIPFPIPPETSSLDVSNNLIEFVRTIDLSDGLDNLRFLQLQNNVLMDIEPGALAKLPNLEVLRLTNNQVRRLRNGTFNGLTNLHTLEAYNLGLESFEPGLFTPLSSIVTLDLSYNNLVDIPTGTFSGFQRLQRLFLSDNFISTVQEGAISNLPHLTTVNLAYNQLRALDVDALSNVPTLRSLSLQGNLIECGCCALWLHTFLLVNELNGPVCEQPQELRGLLLLELSTLQFCDLPSAVITTPPVVIKAESDLQLGCLATGAPSPLITWSRNGMTFDPDDSRVQISGRSLILLNASQQDSGDYHCIATSTAGQVSASVSVAVVMVGANDTIVTLRGDNVILDCVDMRVVEAPLLWTVEGRNVTLGDKYTVIENGSLLIRSVDLDDMRVYECSVGDVVLSYSLQVLAPPQIVGLTQGPCDTPDSIIVPSDESLLINCSAFGIPPPRVSLVFEGEELAASVPPPELRGGTITVTWSLTRPGQEQSGAYTCVANSSLGTTQRTLNVDVLLVLTSGFNPTILRVLAVGDTAVFECDIGQERIAVGSIVDWSTRSGLSLPLERVVFADRNTTLILTDLRLPSDRDGYVCRVRQPTGQRLIVTYDLVLNEPPLIIKEIGVPVVTSLAGSNVSLPCVTRGTPDPEYLWTVNGSSLQESLIANRSSVEIIGQERNRNFGVRLNISSVREGDGGLYNCSASSEINGQRFTDTYTVELQILRLPYFTYQPHPTEVTVGNTATLLCGGRGFPVPMVTWFMKQGNTSRVVNPDLRHIITNHALLIQRAESADEGHYFCTISSPLLSSTSPTAHLRVYRPPRLLSSSLASVRAPVGTDALTLDCSGSGDPDPVIHWLRGDTVLPIAGEQVLLENGSLVLLDLSLQDSDVYRCRLANVAGMVYRNVSVSVQSLPETRVEPSLVTANVGCQVILTCTDALMIADPLDVIWTRQGQRLEEGDRVTILDTGELVLSNLDLQDSGNYTCALWSELGPSQDTAVLIVEDPIFASGAPVAPPTLSTSTPITQTLPLLATAQFVCFVEGFPPPVIEWLRDGDLLPRLRRVEIVGGGLTVSDLRITDNAMYTCRASNPVGMATIDFTLAISVAPTFDVRPTAQSILLGGILTLGCAASGLPAPNTVWLHNNTAVVSDSDSAARVLVDPVTGVLSVNRVTLRDSGVYTCVARSNAGTAESAALVTVQDTVIAPNITVPPRSITTLENQSVSLDCIVFGHPVPTISWLKDDRPIDLCTPDPPSTTVCVDGGTTVFIQSASLQDSGRYTCIATNIGGVALSEAVLSVQPDITLPVFEVYPLPVWISNGSLLRLDCQASSVPPPNISWLLNFDLINVTTSECLEEELMTFDLVVCSNGSLIIQEVDFSDAGFYTCVADNGGGGVSQVSVAVDVGLDLLDTGPLAGPILTSSPPIFKPQQPGDNLTLPCSAEGTPPPTISWLLNGAPINFTASQHIQQLVNGSLLFSSVSQADAGLYTCLASNSQGTAQVTFQLDLSELGELATGNDGAPVITMETKNRVVVEGSKVELQCVAKGQPKPTLLWQFKESMVGHKNGSLFISPVSRHHSGDYTCMAFNTRGAATSLLHLQVTPRQVPPTVSVHPREIWTVVGGSFALSCSGSQWPLAWYRAHQTVESLPGHTQLCDDTLLVEGVAGPGVLEYSCVATSPYGNSTSYATVTITSSLVVSKVYAELDTSLSMLCEGDGGWWRHGQLLTTSSKAFVKDGHLFIYSAQLSDTGEYVCNGQLTYLTVTVSPVIVERGGLVSVARGENVRLPCVVTGVPRPLILWFSDGEPVIGQLDDGSLLLSDVSVSKAYQCIASNIAGTAKNTVYLFVS